MSTDADDPQDMAEALDSDKVGTPDDVDVEPEYPFDELLGADAYGTRPSEEQVGEPLEERVEHESPDPLVEELDRAEERAQADAAGNSVAAELDDLELELDDDALAAIDRIEPLVPDDPTELDDDPDAEAGRLVEPGTDEDISGLDTEAESVARAYEESDLSAEESAVHLTDEPRLGDVGGGYLE